MLTGIVGVGRAELDVELVLEPGFDVGIGDVDGDDVGGVEEVEEDESGGRLPEVPKLERQPVPQ